MSKPTQPKLFANISTQPNQTQTNPLMDPTRVRLWACEARSSLSQILEPYTDMPYRH